MKLPNIADFDFLIPIVVTLLAFAAVFGIILPVGIMMWKTVLQ